MSAVTSLSESAVPAGSGESTLGDLSSPASASRRAKDRTATIAMHSAFVLALVPLVWILWTVISHGYRMLLTSQWWMNSQRGVTVRDFGGGAYHAIIGTLLQAGVTAVISVPIGILTAIYLVEYGRGVAALGTPGLFPDVPPTSTPVDAPVISPAERPRARRASR